MVPPRATASGNHGSKRVIHSSGENIYDVPQTAPLKEHHEAIDYLQDITQGIKDQRYNMDGPTQANVV